MKRRKAIADIKFDKQRGWVLPRFGSKRPYRYWAHPHFEEDTSWEKQLWTLIVDLESAPTTETENILATIFFMAEDAPHQLIQAGAKFELACENNFYTTGIVREIIEE